MRRRFSKSIGRTSTDNETSESAENITFNESMSSAEGFPARIFPTPGKGQDLTESGRDFSSKPFAWFANSDRESLCWKTWQRCLLGDWTEFLGRWPRSGTMRNGIAYRLQHSGSHINGSGSFLFPTPAARDGKDLSRTTAYLSQRKRHSPSMVTELLTHGVPWYAVTEHVEAAMGFPLRWTETGSGDSETPSSHKSRNGLGGG